MIKALFLIGSLLFPGLTAQTSVAVSGRVAAPEAAKGRVMRVALTNVSTSETLTTIVDDDGAFEFSKVTPGSYTVRAFAAISFSQPMPLTVGPNDVSNVAIRLPEPKQINGRIIVQGNLPSSVPLPRVAFALAPFAGIPVSAANLPVNAQPDGTFDIALPEGERQISLAAGSVPGGYKVASVTYGTTDLLKNPIRVTRAENAEVRVTFDASAIVPVKVSGRVANLLSTQGVRVVLMNPTFGSFEASVNPDGSFLFPRVLPGNYTARLSLSGLTAARTVAVGAADVADIVINYPREFIVGGHVIVEGAGTAEPPQVTIEARDAKTPANPSRTATSITNGVLLMNVKDGEYNVTVRTLPAGYRVKSIMFGTTDLQKQPLKIDGPVTWEIIVRLVRE